MTRTRSSWARRLALGTSVLGLLCTACTAGSKAVDWATVERGSLVLEVDATGTLRAVDSDLIGPPALPKVGNYKISMLSPEGSEVKKGDPVLGFDITDLNHRMEKAVAQRDSAAKQVEMTLAEVKVAVHDLALELADAKAQLRKAELKAEAPPEIIASAEMEKLHLDVVLAEKQVAFLQKKGRSAKKSNEARVARWKYEHERAEKRVEQLTSSIEKMTVPAPRDGTVIYETNWRGEKKKVGDSTWRGETVLQVVSLEEMEAQGEVDEVDASKISEGQPASLRLDAQPDLVLRGTVRNISRTVRRQSPENPLKIVRLDIALEQDDALKLRPGMRFRGKIEIDRVDDVLLAPLTAFETTPQGPIAQRKSGAGLEPIPVTLGRRNADSIEILDGLTESDEIHRDPGAETP